MKKVLLIAYQFPPKSGPGVHRSKNLAKHLRKHGYEPIIFTINKKAIEVERGFIDNKQLEDLPADLNIIRTNAGFLSKISVLLMELKVYRLFWYFFYPIFWEWSSLWPFLNYQKAIKIVKQHKINLIYTSSGPFSSMYLGWLLQTKFKIPWVADLRDPFTDAYVWQFPSKIHWKLARLWEKWMFKKPAHLIVNTNEVKKLFISRKLTDPNKISVVNNGF